MPVLGEGMPEIMDFLFACLTLYRSIDNQNSLPFGVGVCQFAPIAYLLGYVMLSYVVVP